MPAPKSPITTLAESLRQMPALKGFSTLKILVGVTKLGDGRSPPSIVLFPFEGGYDSPHDNLASLIDIDLKIVARIWAANVDEAWDLRQRYLQALRQQAIGNPSSPVDATTDQGGVFYELLTEKWDVEADTAQQGQELEVVIAARLSAAPTIQLGPGEIDATGLHGLQTTLAAPMSTTDTSATVASTHGFAASGEVYIDQEQLSYTGLTSTTFTGLTRGLNGTTPAAHASSAVVTQ